MSEWKEVKLGDVCEILDNKRVPIPSNERKKRKGKYPYYGAQGILDYINDYIFDGKYLLVAEDGENLKSRKNNIAFIIKGKFWVNNHAHILVNNDKSILGYLYYSLNYLDISAYITGTAQPKLNQNNLKNLKINLPPLPIQKKIADVLSVIDEKIETLQNINETLEEMAKAIFKSWFVDFDIVKAKAEGKSNSEIAKEFGISEEIIKLFPSEFETSEIGKIPKGWEVGNFEKDCNIVYGKNLPKSKLKEKGYPVFGANGIIGYYDEFLYETPQIIIGCRGIAGKVNITLPNAFITNNSLILEIQNKLLTFEYMKELAYFTDFSIYATGSVQPQITITNIKQHKFLIPPKKIIDYFTKITSNFNNIYFNNLLQIQTLQNLRDTLLPKLINGKIEVDELDIKGITDGFN